jgi:hypothetical protein
MGKYEERRGSALYSKEAELMQNDPTVSLTSKKSKEKKKMQEQPVQKNIYMNED